MWTKWFLPLVNPALAALAALLFFSGGLLVAYKWVDSRAYHRGELAERKVWEAKQLTAERLQHEAMVKDLNTAITVGQSIANALYAAAMAKSQIQTRTQTIVREVERENAKLPNADTCLMPDAVIRLRDEQVRDSATAEASARYVAPKRLGTVQADGKR